jgi:N-acetylmuramoyl-L-alanine amidase
MNKLSFIIFLFFLPLCFASAAAKPVRILIVPGHDDQVWGAEFKGVKEADMTVKLGLMLYDKLSNDKNFQVYITRDRDGYTKEFADYFKNNESAIRQFIRDSRSGFKNQIAGGQVQQVDGVPHNNVSDYVAIRLYGINKWVDENNIDAVIHIHFNDYPRPHLSWRGEYKGFVVYAPEQQLKNSQMSYPLASFVFQSLLKYYPISNYEKESSGIVPDQNLIAVGASNTLNTRSILIEYGYIYEKRFSTFYKRAAEMKTMAAQTYDGIRRYFNFINKK